MLPKRVLFIHDGFGPLRGSEAVLLDLMVALRKSEVEAYVLTDHREFSDMCENYGFRSALIDFPRHGESLSGIRKIKSFFSAANELARIIHAVHPDVIHINNGGSCLWVTMTAWWHQVPTLVHIHAPWSRKMRFQRGLFLPDRIVGVSNAVTRGFKVSNALSQKLRVVYNGICQTSPIAKILNRKDFSIQEDAVVFAFVGVLVGGKRPSDVLKAIALLPEDDRKNIFLLVIGDGPERKTLEELAQGLPVRFLGQRDDVPELLTSLCDVVVLPSEIEAFSIVLLEAALFGLPRIASDAGGNAESILDGFDGYLFPRGDIYALTKLIRRLIADPGLRTQLGRRAQERVQQEFTTQRFIQSFLAIYTELLAEPTPNRIQKLALMPHLAFHMITRKA